MTYITSGMVNVANITTATLTVPAGVTSSFEGFVIVSTAQSTAYTLAPTGSGGGTFANMVYNVEGNSYVAIFSITGVTAGDTISLHGSTTFGADTSLHFFDYTTAFPTIGAVGIRSASQSTTTSGSVSAVAGQKVLLIANERTVATGTTVSSVTVSTGETVTQLSFQDLASPLNNSHYVGEFTAASSGSRTATITYNSGSGNGLAVLVDQDVPTGFTGTATFTGSGSLSAGTATPGFVQSAALSGAGTVVASGTVPGSGAGVFTGTGSLAASGGPTASGSASLSGTGTVTASGAPAASSTASLSGSGTVVVAGPTPVQAYIADRPMYAAHRGGSADWVEETAYAYDQATAWGIKALEISCWQTSDGVFVASHDQTTGRLFGTNLDIPTNTWATLSALRTTVGNYPLARVTDILDAHGANKIVFMDYKKNDSTGSTALLNLLDASYGGKNRVIAKAFCTSLTWIDAATARGYSSWGYYYSADVATNLPATQSHFTLLGMDVLSASSADWTAVKSYGKPVLGHIVATAAQATTGFGFGADGLMVSGVMEVVPYSGSTPPLTGTGTLTASGTSGGTATASFSGSGSLSATQTATAATGSASLSGSGTVVASGAPTAKGTASLSGSGTVVTTATQATALGAAVFSGSGAVAASGTASQPGSVSLSGTGVLAATQTQASSGGSASFSGTGTVVASGALGASGSASLSGAGAVVASGSPAEPGSASLSGSGTVAASGTASQPGSVNLSGSGTVVASGSAKVSGVATLLGFGTLMASGNGAATLLGVGTLTTTGTPGASSAAIFTGTGQFSAFNPNQASSTPLSRGLKVLASSRTLAIGPSSRTLPIPAAKRTQVIT